MIRLAANLSFLFHELPFLDRFAAAAKAGFRAVEFTFAYDVPPREIAARLHDNGLQLVLINTPPGNAAAGEIGLAVLPGRERDLEAAFDRALEYATLLDAPLIHFLAGRPPASLSRTDADTLFLANLARAAKRAAAVNLTLTLEPLNQRDRPGYHISTNAHARALIEAAGRDNIRLQFDLYHCQITSGDLIRSLERDIDLIAHVQIASVPERAEPGLGEIAYANVLTKLDELGYSGFVGCEYSPRGSTIDGLAWAAPYLQARGAKE
jgi:hydroxypyruvate isomerase